MTIPADARHLALCAVSCAAGEAREFTDKLLREWAVDGDASYDLLLIVSELVTNAVVHGAAPISLWLWTADGCVRGAADDHGNGTPRMASPEAVFGDDVGEHGRGLALVAAVARTVGWQRLPHGGVRMWFSYALPGENSV